ncbi:hypothetical protein ABL78_3288 [Leptomonas seymouri]|uniref:Uncharacterized protein n=1 Tax=Leptomonas seymouri TaxID=5684 RepID=A0A0N1I6D8_LEPSE|nr:hypothetical protein ABL78_3288 [Leptomonas seymouri]|eukprot:KPI87631.1 hypothetical protein ABL78_3288 [Leptomonas seymouri]
MSADTLPVANPKTLGRLDALPGSLGKVTLCAVFTLGVAAFVSVRKWLAARSVENSGDHRDHKASAKYSFRSKGKGSSSGSGGGGGGAGHSNNASAGRVGDGASVSGEASPSSPQRPPLPPRNYFTIRASLHVKRHNAKMMEWFDEQLGIQLPFSQQLFELKQEERQAPLVLLLFRTLREPTHRMVVTIEELYDVQTSATYCEASLSRISDCASLLETSTALIGRNEYPAAEYCYVDETQATVFTFSLFIVHERLAVTLQYAAPTRVRSVLPTAFYDLARFLIFTAPSPSPSYLLISEPRLGLGYHLPLDFLVHEGLAEGDGVEDRLFAWACGGRGGGAPPMQEHSYGGPPQQSTQHTRGAQGLANMRAYSDPLRGGGGFYAGRGEGGDWVVPYATAMSRGGRRMGLITSYEPPMGASSSSSDGGGLMDATSGGSSGFGAASRGGASGVPYAWRLYLEQQVCKAARQLGLVMGSGSDGHGGGPRVIFQASDLSDTSAYANSAHTLLIEPYPLSVALSGNFSASDDGREEDSDAMGVTAFSLFREVRVDVNSSYLTLVPDTLAAAPVRTASAAAGSTSDAPPATVKAYWSAFYVPVGAACVSFHFIASALRHTSTEFISFCASVMNSISLGNHHGQAVSVLYCNIRHDVLPFRLSLPPTGMATVAEPMLGDPLCVVQATYGVEQIAVTVRVFPLFVSNAASSGTAAGSRGGNGYGGGGNAKHSSVQGGKASGGPRSGTPAAAGVNTLATPNSGSLDARPTSPPRPMLVPPMLRSAERRGSRQRSAMRQLQYMIRYYLNQFPGGVHIVSYAKTTVNSMPALLLCFRPMWSVNGEENGGASGIDGGAVSSLGTAGAVNYWDNAGGVGGGESSQGASSWGDMREVMLEDEVGQLNPFAQHFTPPPPPASYLWGPQPGTTTAATSAALPTQPALSAAMKNAAADVGRDKIGTLFRTSGAGDSQRSREELDDPLRVAVAVCCEGNAFLFQTSASEYTMGVAQEAVRATATYLALIPRAG